MYAGCYDGDTCTFILHGKALPAATRLYVRLRGIDAPELRNVCPRERRLAQDARIRLRAMLRHAKHIELVDVVHARRGRYGRHLQRHRVLATVLADGVNVGRVLVKQGLARRLGRRPRPAWCPGGPLDER